MSRKPAKKPVAAKAAAGPTKSPASAWDRVYALAAQAGYTRRSAQKWRERGRISYPAREKIIAAAAKGGRRVTYAELAEMR